jgi:hypothetical protein
MIEDVSAGLAAVTVPVTIVIGDRYQVEHETALRAVGRGLLPGYLRVSTDGRVCRYIR